MKRYLLSLFALAAFALFATVEEPASSSQDDNISLACGCKKRPRQGSTPTSDQVIL